MEKANVNISVDPTRLNLLYYINRLLYNFVPSFFATIMATGILGNLYYNCPHQFPGLKYIGMSVAIFNASLFVLFVILTFLRCMMYPKVVKSNLMDPLMCAATGTIPMGMGTIIIGIGFMLSDHPAAMNAAWILWWIDVTLSVIVTFGVPILMFNLHDVKVEKVTGVYLLTAIPAIVAAGAGAIIAARVGSTQNALTTIIVSYMLLGAGLGLAFLILTLYFQRIMVHKIPPKELIISSFIPLGPLGMGSFAILQLSQAGKVYAIEHFTAYSALASDVISLFSVIIALMMWGFGLWLLFHAITSVIIIFKRDGQKHSNTTWAFIFPLGVYTQATISLSRIIPSIVFAVIADGFIITLTLLYIYCFVVISCGIWKGTIFPLQPPVATPPVIASIELQPTTELDLGPS